MSCPCSTLRQVLFALSELGACRPRLLSFLKNAGKALRVRLERVCSSPGFHLQPSMPWHHRIASTCSSLSLCISRSTKREARGRQCRTAVPIAHLEFGQRCFMQRPTPQRSHASSSSPHLHPNTSPHMPRSHASTNRSHPRANAHMPEPTSSSMSKMSTSPAPGAFFPGVGDASNMLLVLSSPALYWLGCVPVTRTADTFSVRKAAADGPSVSSENRSRVMRCRCVRLSLFVRARRSENSPLTAASAEAKPRSGGAVVPALARGCTTPLGLSCGAVASVACRGGGRATGRSDLQQKKACCCSRRKPVAAAGR